MSPILAQTDHDSTYTNGLAEYGFEKSSFGARVWLRVIAYARQKKTRKDKKRQDKRRKDKRRQSRGEKIREDKGYKKWRGLRVFFAAEQGVRNCKG
jgi:hypothetical protein